MELINIWKKKILETPNDPIAHYNLAVAYTKDYDFENALKHYNIAINLAPDFVNAYINSGSIYSLKKEYSRAIEYYNKALKFQPNDIQTLYNIATAYLNSNNLAAAKKLFLQIIDISPNFIPAYNNLAFLYIRQDNIPAAIEEYKRALTFKADEPFINYNIALSYYKLKDLENAAIYIFEELKINKDNQDVVSLYIKILGERLNDDALEMLNILEPLTQIIKSSFLETALGLLYFKINDFSRAEKAFQSAINKDPTNAVALNNLGYIFLQKQIYDIAEECFKKAIIFDNRHIQAYNNLAELYIALNRYNEAIEIYNTLLKYAPDFSFTHFNLGKLYYKTNDLFKARLALAKFIADYNNDDNLLKEARELLMRVKFLIG